MARQELIAHFGVPDLRDVGLQVASAGTHGLTGRPATSEMQAVAAEMGLDLTDHRATRVDRHMLDGATLIYAMEEDQVTWLRAQFPLSPGLLLGEANIDDPYGRSLSEYRRAGREIAEAVRLHTPEMMSLAS